LGHEANAERPLSVQSTDLRGDTGQRARRAERCPWAATSEQAAEALEATAW